MIVFFLLIFYISILFFAVVSILKIANNVSAPLHLSWELYCDNPDFERSRSIDKIKIGLKEKLISSARDIFFLRRYYKQNRSFWYPLYMFHLGVYLLVLWHIFLFGVPIVFTGLSLVLKTAPIDINTHVAYTAGLFVGHAAVGMIFLGSIGILFKRITDKELRAYYPKIYYFKWILIIITLLSGLYPLYFYFNGNIYDVFSYIKEELNFNLTSELNLTFETYIHGLIISMWLIYLPFSHVIRIFSRYYHELRWDYLPNRPGGIIEKRIGKLVDLPVRWSAPHIQPDRTWKELIQEQLK